MNQNMAFLVWPTIAGILAALLILDRWVLPGRIGADGQPLAVVSYADAVREATPSVVNIYTTKLVTQRRLELRDHPFFGGFVLRPHQRQRIERSLGSGVIMSAEGHVLTNYHVIEGADEIEVMLFDGRNAIAKVIGADRATDLAVLRVELPGLQPITLGDSDAVRVGDVVLAIGNPLGFGHSVTQGIVSALGRFGLQLNVYENYIQTDAISHLGNSGGALVDTRGRLLGINSLIYGAAGQQHSGATASGISLAIPERLAVFVMQDLIDYGEVIRGWLGISVVPLGAMGGRGQSLLVVDVAADSPAQRAGLQVDDIVTHLNGEPVRDGRQTMLKIAMLRPGETVSIALQRNGQSLELRAIVGANQSLVP